MDTYKNMSYDNFLIATIRNDFIPMYGFNFQNSITKKMDNEYHISANLDKGLFLTSESHNNILYESKLYYELDISKAIDNSEAINHVLELIKDTTYVYCDNSDNKSILSVRYDATNKLISHLNMLNHKEVSSNNPWKHLEKHNIDIIRLNEDRIKIHGYKKNNDWIDTLPKEAKYMIGYKNLI